MGLFSSALTVFIIKIKKKNNNTGGPCNVTVWLLSPHSDEYKKTHTHPVIHSLYLQNKFFQLNNKIYVNFICIYKGLTKASWWADRWKQGNQGGWPRQHTHKTKKGEEDRQDHWETHKLQQCHNIVHPTHDRMKCPQFQCLKQKMGLTKIGHALTHTYTNTPRSQLRIKRRYGNVLLLISFLQTPLFPNFCSSPFFCHFSLPFLSISCSLNLNIIYHSLGGTKHDSIYASSVSISSFYSSHPLNPSSYTLISQLSPSAFASKHPLIQSSGLNSTSTPSIQLLGFFQTTFSSLFSSSVLALVYSSSSTYRLHLIVSILRLDVE